MKFRCLPVAFAAPFLAAALVAAPAVTDEHVVLELPADYKHSLELYMISDRVGQEDQVIALYANAAARDAVRAGQAMPDGAVLVGEIFKAEKDASGNVVKSGLGRRVPAELAAIVMMERRAEWAADYPDELKLAGWEFGVFSPAGENLVKNTKACRECHAKHADTDFVFSLEHIGAVN